MLQSSMYVVCGFLIINLIVFVHEFGHFAAAKLMRVDIQVISFGVGLPVFMRTGRNSITEIRVSMLPLGGYCRMAGSKDLKRARGAKRIMKVTPGSMYSVSPFARMLIYAAGPLFNFAFSIFLLAVFHALPVRAPGGPVRVARYERDVPEDMARSFADGDEVLEVNGQEIRDFSQLYAELKEAAGSRSAVDAVVLRNGERKNLRVVPRISEGGEASFGIMKYEEMRVGRISHRGREYAAGLRERDAIVSVDGRDVVNSADFFKAVESCGAVVRFGVLRGGDEFEIAFIPRRDGDGDGIKFDFALDTATENRSGAGFSESVARSASESVEFAEKTFSSLFSVFRGTIGARGVFSGPMRASGAIGEITDVGRSVSFMSAVRAALYMAAMVSASLCVINLLPLPSLDGGGIVVGVFESFSEDGLLSVRAYRTINVLSFVTTVVLMALIWVSDLLSRVG